MSERGGPSFATAVALCRRRPGLLVREFAWRWFYGIPALAAVAVACFHIYRTTRGALLAAGAGRISLVEPYRSAVIFARSEQILRPHVTAAALWLLPLLGLGWAAASGVGRNVVFRAYEPGLAWRPVALSCVQLLRVVALAATLVLWWGSIRWSAATSTVAGVPNLPVYFALAAGFTIAYLLLWSLSSWVLSIAPLFLLVERFGIIRSLRRSILPGPITGRLVGINLAVAAIRLALAVAAMVLSVVPMAFAGSPESIGLYLWWGGVTVLYLVISGFFQVVRLVAFLELWNAAPNGQNTATPSLP